MTIARAHLVDPSVTRWYHCVTRRVRRAFLLGEGCTTGKAGSNIGSRNLLKSSRWASRDLRSWTITCTCWCGWIRTLSGASRMRMLCDAGDASFRHATRRDRWPRSRRSRSRRG